MHDNRSEYQSREYKRYPDQKPDIGLANGINSAVEKARADVEREALQRHHDYYIELKRQGKLTETDRLQYDLAKEREKQGLVYKS
ncbi:MAG TPA: hypothetical protein VLH94_02910, partial [Spirochaetia bacterium]|nr:hypothetical protein [Spirochaetia bacterium]